MSAKYTQEDILERFHTLAVTAENLVSNWDNWEKGNISEAVDALEGAAESARDLLHDLGYPKNRNTYV